MPVKLSIVVGPWFVTVIWYVTSSPATGWPLVRIFTTFRSATRAITSVTVDLLSSGSGSITPAGGWASAVFTRSPRASPGTVPESVIVTLSPVASISPVHAPVAGLYEPMLGTPKVAPIKLGAVVSSSVKPRIVLGPLFVTSIS